jgi:hypothetical protein
MSVGALTKIAKVPDAGRHRHAQAELIFEILRPAPRRAA